MSRLYFYLNKKIKSLDTIFLIALLCFSCQLHNLFSEEEIPPPLSPITEQFSQKFQKINKEVRQYECPISEKLLTCSYFQDLWLSFMYNAESVEDYHKGMQLFEDYTDGFRSICQYITTVFNFYTGGFHTPTPQTVEVSFHGKNAPGFFNTFKVGRSLTSEERELYFSQEEANYLRDALVTPFVLDEATLATLEEKTIYNFALLPNGTIRAALEKPGSKEYHVINELVEEAFQYPNHTIIVGSPHQVVITAGSFIFYRFEGKQLFFISCKSGHYQPSYHSLVHMNTQLSKLGIHPSTIISTPTVDMSQSIIKKYTNAQIPLAITHRDTETLFKLAQTNWNETYQKIDKGILRELAKGNIAALDAGITAALNNQREESTYMRSAFNLFTESHAAPRTFHKLVKNFGKLKDAIKHNMPDKIQSGAASVLNRMDAYEQDSHVFALHPADDASFYYFMKNLIASMEELLAHAPLLVGDYHLLKKQSRELAALFHYLSQSLKTKEKGYFIYLNASQAFFEINERMAKTHDEYIAKLLRGEIEPNEVIHIELAPKISEELKGYLKQIGLLPIQYRLTVDSEGAWWMINSAKEWYISHTKLLFKNYGSSEKLILRSFLRHIVNGKMPDSSFAEELKQLHGLKRDAEIARNALIFLDAQHEAPQEIHDYISSISGIIQAIKNKTFQQAHEDALYLLSVKRAPTSALAKWQCTNEDSFTATLKSYLNHLLPLMQDMHITKEQANETLEKLQAIQDLINLFRRNRSARNKNLPLVCYDSLEEHAEALVKDLQTAMRHLIEDRESILITPSMTFHAHFILSRIFS